MGQFTNITIKNAPAITIEQLERITEDHLNDSTVSTEDNGDRHIEGSSKWSPEEFISRIVTLAEPFPEATVVVDEEWDTRDADEPGQVIRRFRAGSVISEATMVSSLVPGDLTEAISSVRAALAGNGDLARSAAWLADGLEDKRV